MLEFQRTQYSIRASEMNEGSVQIILRNESPHNYYFSSQKYHIVKMGAVCAMNIRNSMKWLHNFSKPFFLSVLKI